MRNRIDALKEFPMHRYLGLQDLQAKDGNAELTAIVNENVVNLGGFYHGGATYTLCDVCAYSGLVSILDETKQGVTHDIHLSILRPAFKDQIVTYRSAIKKLGKSLCFMDVEASVDGKTIATARVTKSIIDVG